MINFTSALELLRNLRGAAQEIDHAPISQGLLDLQGQLLSLQIQVLEQQVESRLLQNETARLRNCLSTARRLERVNDVYFVVNNDGEARGPFCVACWNRREVLQALVEAEEGVGYCPNCKVKARTGRRRKLAGAPAA